LNLVRISYSKDEGGSLIQLSFSEKTLCYLFSIAIIILGLMPLKFMDLFRQAM